jgi:hypothetical protein
VEPLLIHDTIGMSEAMHLCACGVGARSAILVTVRINAASSKALLVTMPDGFLAVTRLCWMAVGKGEHDKRFV